MVNHLPYIPLLLKGKPYPVRVGGYTGKSRLKLTKEQERMIFHTLVESDKKKIKKHVGLINKTVIGDIKNAIMVWINKAQSRLIPLDTEELQFVIDGSVVMVPIRSLKRYGKPTEIPTKKASAKAAWFGNGKTIMKPFSKFSNEQLLASLIDGVKLVDELSMVKKLRTPQSEDGMAIEIHVPVKPGH
jgi:hypothetical protein